MCGLNWHESLHVLDLESVDEVPSSLREQKQEFGWRLVAISHQMKRKRDNKRENG